MKTASTEYYRNLYRIQQDNNLPSLAVLLPSTENIYNVNLNTRVINAPEYLGVKTDHTAEVIYFRCDRFFDYMDLSQANIIIQYENANGDKGIYPVPFVDVATYSLENKMLIPWCVDGNVTTKAGEVKFSIRFYKLDEDGRYVTYMLTTLPATSVVYETQDYTEDAEKFTVDPDQYAYLINRINELQNHLDLEWIVLV